ncbi:hypothetical protein, partial [Halomonas sp. 707B3]|uniref:hypothetical protein n=1 Tax=Halomonas sp. 707B3 TaxID=1681043 RepID=UPI00209FE3FF
LAKANLHGANDQKVLAGGDRESVGAGFTDSGLRLLYCIFTTVSEDGRLLLFLNANGLLANDFSNSFIAELISYSGEFPIKIFPALRSTLTVLFTGITPFISYGHGLVPYMSILMPPELFFVYTLFWPLCITLS